MSVRYVFNYLKIVNGYLRDICFGKISFSFERRDKVKTYLSQSKILDPSPAFLQSVAGGMYSAARIPNEMC